MDRQPPFEEITMSSTPRSTSPRRPARALALAVALLLPAAVLAQTASSLKLQVNGMVCAFCAQGIEKRLKALPEAGPIFIDLRNKVVAVESRAGQPLNAERVASEVRQAGYDVVNSETVPRTVAQIRAEVRAARQER
jgi:cation transport ATPase